MAFISAAYWQRLQISQENIWHFISRNLFILMSSLTTSLALTDVVTLSVFPHTTGVVCSWCVLLRGYPQHVPSSYTMGYPPDAEWRVHFDAHLIYIVCLSTSTQMLQEGIPLFVHNCISTTWHHIDTQQKAVVWGALLSYQTLTSMVKEQRLYLYKSPTYPWDFAHTMSKYTVTNKDTKLFILNVIYFTNLLNIYLHI